MRFRAALSVGLCLGFAAPYAIPTDALYGLTVWPASLWAIPGLLAVLARRRLSRGSHLWIPLAAWIAFLAAFTEALELDPDNARARYGLGMSHLLGGDEDAAVAEYVVLKEIDDALAHDLYKNVFKYRN